MIKSTLTMFLPLAAAGAAMVAATGPARAETCYLREPIPQDIEESVLFTAGEGYGIAEDDAERKSRRIVVWPAGTAVEIHDCFGWPVEVCDVEVPPSSRDDSARLDGVDASFKVGLRQLAHSPGLDEACDPPSSGRRRPAAVGLPAMIARTGKPQHMQCAYVGEDERDNLNWLKVRGDCVPCNALPMKCHEEVNQSVDANALNCVVWYDRGREEFRTYVDGRGRLRDRDGRLLDSHGGRAIYVIDMKGEIYVALKPSDGYIHHSTLTGGRPVLAAGQIVLREGKVEVIDLASGHYRPNPCALNEVDKVLRARGVARTRRIYSYVKAQTFGVCKPADYARLAPPDCSTLVPWWRPEPGDEPRWFHGGTHPVY
jgi:hypothetical protein